MGNVHAMNFAIFFFSFLFFIVQAKANQQTLTNCTLKSTLCGLYITLFLSFLLLLFPIHNITLSVCSFGSSESCCRNIYLYRRHLKETRYLNATERKEWERDRDSKKWDELYDIFIRSFVGALYANNLFQHVRSVSELGFDKKKKLFFVLPTVCHFLCTLTKFCCCISCNY